MENRSLLLRSRIIIRLRIHKIASLEVGYSHLNREALIRLDRVQILRKHEFRRRHVVHARYDAHRSGVARSVLDMPPVCQGIFARDGGAEVDVVVGGCERFNLAGFGTCCVLAVLCVAGLDQ